MAKTRTRFSVRKVKCCYRNSMIVGNPIEKIFERFGVCDKDYKDDIYSGLGEDSKYLYRGYCRCKYAPGDFSTTRRWRRLCETKEEAQKIADEMNRL